MTHKHPRVLSDRRRLPEDSPLPAAQQAALNLIDSALRLQAAKARARELLQQTQAAVAETRRIKNSLPKAAPAKADLHLVPKKQSA